jgi:hypothetical protein
MLFINNEPKRLGIELEVKKCAKVIGRSSECFIHRQGE